MTRAEVQKLCEECSSLIGQGQKIEAIRRWRAQTKDGLGEAKHAIDTIEAGTALVHLYAEADPELIKLYRDAVPKQLLSIGGLTVQGTLHHVPTLKRYVLDELDRWYIIYKEALATSVFSETKLQFDEFDEDVTFGDKDWRKNGDDWVAKIACDYTNIIRKISDQCRYLATMKKEDFPGVKV